MNLPDEKLLEAYYKAIELKLEEEFIKNLEKEIEKRQLAIIEEKSG
ncbi:sporulation histidine kinase inhibitor Sda [Aquibacillus koreensis]|uniref:Sporulation histidine kinase inhibitor Sda n=1 Tax=Aquibacillus koreensis TaxID=279446 RepID=A0A9X3WMX1_9BACI|nr:sporulation histidine kinase inhibitor Sda [Aquibacillus koreensis]MCT2536661.1 sporulation histidine kinase inhibitor Sda [Aquibacillus koreensis]MDC3422615.1 sporulation histidine kinase inhibitor Sda [Aquibacillus koreensis]